MNINIMFTLLVESQPTETETFPVIKPSDTYCFWSFITGIILYGDSKVIGPVGKNDLQYMIEGITSKRIWTV